MAKLKFNIADVKRVVDHSLAAKEQGLVAYTNDPVKEPSLILVHDQGVYLMSNGIPRDIVKGTSSFVAYAKGCNPHKDVDFYDNARDLVGGDDFAETLQVAKDIKDMLNRGATGINIILTANHIKLEGVFRKAK